jgi:Fur family zinc uptake transcriptional regulator
VQSRELNQNDRLVLTALGRAERPLSAYDILDQTRSGSIKAPTQVYRSLQKLEGQGLVHRIEALSAFVACSDQHDHEHRPGFVICRGCNSVREFEAPKLLGLAQEVAGEEFSLESVSLEIFGRCGACKDSRPETRG